MKALALLAVYAGCVVASVGFELADENASYHEYRDLACRDYRKNLGFSIGYSLLPVIPWAVTLFSSGFYEHGWTLRRPADCK